MKENLQKQATFSSAIDGENRLRVSSGFLSSVRAVMAVIPNSVGLVDVRVLHREKERSKLFFILAESSVEATHAIVQTMSQIEQAFPSESFDYDTLTTKSAALIPADAFSLLA